MKLDEVLNAIIQEVGEGALSFYHPSRDFIITDSIVTDEDARKITVD